MNEFTNPLSNNNFSDPFITYDKDTSYYYYIASCQSDVLTIYRNKRVGNILKDNDKKDVFICGQNSVFGPMWAPEMYKIGNRWYIYTSCREKDTPNHWDTKRILILKSKTEDPFDGFEFGSKPDVSIFAIDPSCTFINNKQYICYSMVEATGEQVLVIREMIDPLTFSNKFATISRASLSWELVPPYTGNGSIVEGAFFIKKDNRIFIVYSANGCWSDDYCLGVLEYTSGDVCSANSWIKHTKPLFVKGNGIYGPGHASFFKSPDGKETWCAYHCLLHSNPKSTEMIRHTCIQKIEYDETGFPVMVEPVGINKPIPVPSGENL